LKKIGITASRFNGYWAETGNLMELATAGDIGIWKCLVENNITTGFARVV